MSDKNPHPFILRHVTVLENPNVHQSSNVAVARSNLCRMTLTVYDLDVRDVRRMTAEERREWSICPMCMRVLVLDAMEGRR